jgi:hypothetical protein
MHGSPATQALSPRLQSPMGTDVNRVKQSHRFGRLGRESHAAYQNLIAYGKDAGPYIPVLKQVKAKYANRKYGDWRLWK